VFCNLEHVASPIGTRRRCSADSPTDASTTGKPIRLCVVLQQLGSFPRPGNGKRRRGSGPLEEPAPARPSAHRFGWRGLTPRWPRSLRLGSASG
jgi:hypothetical protein